MNGETYFEFQQMNIYIHDYLHFAFIRTKNYMSYYSSKHIFF